MLYKWELRFALIFFSNQPIKKAHREIKFIVISNGFEELIDS